MGVEAGKGGGRRADFFKINLASGSLVQSVANGEDATGKKLYTKTVHQPGTKVTGVLQAISFAPNVFDGKVEGEVLRLRLADTDETQPDMIIELGVSNNAGPAMNGLKFLGKLAATPVLDAPISIQPWFIPKGTKSSDPKYGPSEMDQVGINLYQGGEKIVEDYGNGVKELPKLEPVMILKGGVPTPMLDGNGKQVKDKQPWIDLLASLKATLSPTQAEGQPEDEGISAGDIPR